MTTFSNAIREGLDNFFSTSGRMSRSAFWWFALFCTLVGGAFFMIVAVTVGINANNYTFFNLIIDIPLWYILFVPGIRRLHDIDKSGTNTLWILLPVIGWIYLIILFCRPSDPDENFYGEPTF